MTKYQRHTHKMALPLLCLATLLATATLKAQNRGFRPAPSLDLELAAPIQTWDEAIPLGNGLLGGLLWGEGDILRLSLDRGDLWDLRIPERLEEDDYTWQELKKEVDRQDQAAVIRRFDSTYNSIKYPTKLPGGRLEIQLAAGQSIQSFGLDLSEAVGRVRLTGGAVIQGFYSADAPVGLFRIPGPAPRQLRLIPPDAVKQLHYDPAQSGSEGDTQWFVQKAAKNLQYAAVIATKRLPGETLLAVTLTATWDGSHPVPAGRKLVGNALAQGYEACLAPHLDYWHGFWGQSRIDIPDQNILKHYTLVNYYLGAASRPGAPPMPLQGVWTADGGGLPPWKGDFHHDLNTQMTYVSYLTAGHFEEGEVFLDFMYDLLPQFREFARKFYAAPGAAVPGVMTLDGKPMSGWVQYSLSPTNGAWVAWMFYRHWCYTHDPEDLRRAYAFCEAIGTCLEHLLQEENGTLKLPLSSSPEIHNNSLRAWLKPNSNYDRDCMRALFLGLRDMASALHLPTSRAWARLADSLGAVWVDPETGVRMFAEGEPFNASHRHHSHIMGLHPFGLQSTRSETDRPVIHATLDRVNELGTRAWTGYSFSWIACTFARAGRAEEALRYLDLYVNAFILRNGFNVNGDQLKAGFSSFTYRPFTLEGNFLAPEAVHDMLLQSWGGRVQVFPAMPWRWHHASFTRLRAEGGWIVSAQWDNNACTYVEIEATRDAELVLADSFNGREVRWNRPVTRRESDTFVFRMKAGDKLIGTLDRPAALPPQPAQAYRGFELPAQTPPAGR
jgi:alpha-L-fucosidase 2